MSILTVMHLKPFKSRFLRNVQRINWTRQQNIMFNYQFLLFFEIVNHWNWPYALTRDDLLIHQVDQSSYVVFLGVGISNVIGVSVFMRMKTYLRIWLLTHLLTKQQDNLPVLLCAAPQSTLLVLKLFWHLAVSNCFAFKNREGYLCCSEMAFE